MTTSKVGASQVRSPRALQQAAVPSKAKEGTPTSKTTALGWSPAAGKGGGLKITSASIGEGPKTTDAVAVPTGFQAEVKTLAQKSTDTVHGIEVSIEQSAQTLTVRGPGGKRFSLGESAAALKQTAAEWKEEVTAAKKIPKEDWMQLDWSSEANVRGAGSAGQLFSISQGGSYYTGGAHPSNGSAVNTFDARTGKQVKLEELLSTQQMSSLVKDIEARLPKIKGADEYGAEAFGFGDDRAALREVINANFALSTDKSGKVKIDIAWESGVHALGGLMAHFKVDAPADEGFRQKIGLE